MILKKKKKSYNINFELYAWKTYNTFGKYLPKRNRIIFSYTHVTRDDITEMTYRRVSGDNTLRPNF